MAFLYTNLAQVYRETWEPVTVKRKTPKLPISESKMQMLKSHQTSSFPRQTPCSISSPHSGWAVGPSGFYWPGLLSPFWLHPAGRLLTQSGDVAHVSSTALRAVEMERPHVPPHVPPCSNGMGPRRRAVRSNVHAQLASRSTPCITESEQHLHKSHTTPAKACSWIWLILAPCSPLLFSVVPLWLCLFSLPSLSLWNFFFAFFSASLPSTCSLHSIVLLQVLSSPTSADLPSLFVPTSQYNSQTYFAVYKYSIYYILLMHPEQKHHCFQVAGNT